MERDILVNRLAQVWRITQRRVAFEKVEKGKGAEEGIEDLYEIGIDIDIVIRVFRMSNGRALQDVRRDAVVVGFSFVQDLVGVAADILIEGIMCSGRWWWSRVSILLGFAGLRW